MTRVVPILVLAALSVPAAAQQPGRAGQAPAALVQQVRTALGHGAVDQARQIAASSTAPAPTRALASALVDIFEGKDEDARAKLTPLAGASPLGEAAVELGLLELRYGQRDAGMRRLDVPASLRTFSGDPDEYFRLARAAVGRREFKLADDAFNKTIDVKRADIQTAWGDMEFVRRKNDLALQSYQAALAADASWVTAHLGIARVLEDENPAKAAAEFEAARKLAPDHPEVLKLMAERQLGNDDFAGAAQSLDRLAKVKAGAIDEPALRAAVAYGQRRPADVETELARVKQVDPTSALGFRRATEQAIQAYRFDDAAGYARRGVALDAADPDALFDLGLVLMRTGDEKEARVELERSWELDKSNLVTKNLLDMMDDLDKFEVVPDGDMIFKFAKEDVNVLKPYALPLAEEAYKTYVQRYGFTPKGPILIEVFPKHDDFAVRTIGLPGIEGALGACFGRVVSMDSPRARPNRDFSWHATLWHEMAHVFTLQLSEFRVPRWLTEGISVYEEYRRNPAWGRELTLEYAHRMATGETFGVKKLPEAFRHAQSLSLGYFEASLVTEYLVGLNGDAGLRTLLLAYAGGANDADALTKAFGKSLDEVDAGFRTFVDQKFGSLRDAMKTPATEVDPDDLPKLRARAAASPGSYISQVTYARALVRSGDVAGARAPLERAAELAPAALGNSSPHALLAQSAVQQGDLARARKELRLLLAHDHTNMPAARQLAKLAADAGAAEDEEAALRLIADVDPIDVDVHGRLGRRLLATNRLAPALVEFQAVLALGPPNLAEAHTDVAEVLLKLNRKDEAKREAMQALVEAPSYARAQDILLAAIAR